MNERARPMLLASEVALTALTVSAAVGLLRLFVDASIVPKVAAAGIAAHVVAAACRHNRLGAAATAGIGIVTGAAVVCWLVVGETTTLGVPSTETVDVVRAHLRDAWAQFGEVKAPAPVLPGFVLAATAGTWALAFLADTAAFRAAGTVEAMVPASTLFVFGAALGAPRSRVLCTALYLASLLGFWLTARALAQVSAPTWMERGDGGTRSLFRTGALIGGACVVGAVVIGPSLPGAEAAAVIPWRASDRGDGGSRVTISPLVNIRTRIVDQAPTEVFRVRSSERSYWRLTALETFDGTIWSSSRKYRRADGTLTSAFPEEERATDVVEQRFTIVGLDTIWLPAAFRPVGIDGVDARYDPESGSLLAEAASAIGQQYTVESAVPRLEPALLESAPPEVPAAIAEQYLALPADFPQDVRDLAAEVVAGSSSAYQAARRLQDYFRSGEFTYDLDVPRGHSDDALRTFLFETRRGYCEQFAGSYAAMARAIGLPARIGVGFTTGELTSTNTYTVRGYHGHAWPEVYLNGVGWVAFEPTPGRGIPGGEAYTGVPESQASPDEPNTATTLATTTTAAPANGGSVTTSIPQLGDRGGDVPEFDEQARHNPWPRRLVIAAAFLLAAPLLWVAGLATYRLAVRTRRRLSAHGDRRVTLAWEELGEVFARFGVRPRPSETPAEFARRASAAAALEPARLGDLAALTTAARYAPAEDGELDDETVAAALAETRELERTIRSRLGRRERVRWLVDPRSASI